MAHLCFQFWDDRQYRSYDPPLQSALVDAFLTQPRPLRVQLHGGTYVVNDFDKVEYGKACQINQHTGFERHVRLQCPYVLPAHTPLSLPVGFRFQYFDSAWHDYGPGIQHELKCVVACCPVPAQMLFTSHGNLYRIIGLETLNSAANLEQVNVMTGTRRKVRLFDPSHSSASPAYLPLHCQVSTLSFRVCRGAVWHPVPVDVQNALLEAWKEAPRPKQFSIDGDISMSVEDYDKLEEGGATMCVRGESLALEVQLPLPHSSFIALPDELDINDDGFVSCGSQLQPSELTALLQKDADSVQCAICLGDMEASGTCSTDDACFQLACGHVFHKACLQQWWDRKKRCPQCQRDFGKAQGEQPREGTMRWCVAPFSLEGMPHGTPTLLVDFSFPPGVDRAGVAYKGRKERCFLPGNTQGILLLELFKVAFRRCVMFGLGSSMSLGVYRPTFNIHVKTSMCGGRANHGYPDDDYFARTMQELQSNGVSIADCIDDMLL
eukprot:TRINITY_DN27719_c0_g1_i1.p1 TRINITY_DN27719_c0_g1~~TRINITY_DN27719_c0_g1_i1.p1  ORF type:complete len:507 (+),score=52.84 TRINITY_DN27719_c0_g1_i1:45-1523(+)